MNKREVKRGRTATKTAESEPKAESGGKRGRRIPARVVTALIAVVYVVFLVVTLVSLVGIRSQYRERKGELDEIREEISIQEIKNEEMNRTYKMSDEERSGFLEQKARDELDYVREGERIFVIVAGD